MNNKQIKKLLKQKADKVSINDYSQSILLNVKDVEKENKTRNSNIRFIIPSLAAVFCAISALFVVFLNSNNQIDGKTPLTNTSKAKQILSTEVFALANTFNEPSLINYRRSITTSEAESLTNEIHDYLLTGEMLLNKDNVNVKDSLNTNKDYDFEKVLSVSYTNNNKNYTLYYTESAAIVDYDDIDEVNSTINGVMIINNKEYIVEGKKEVENDEIESSLKLITSPTSYIQISMETEKNENEYTYSYYEDNKLIKELSLEAEVKNNKKEMNIEITTLDNEKEFSFEYKKDYIICNYEDEVSDSKEKINIEIHEDYYLYVFNESIKIKKNK